jgi:hypothetical protein
MVDGRTLQQQTRATPRTRGAQDARSDFATGHSHFVSEYCARKPSAGHGACCYGAASVRHPVLDRARLVERARQRHHKVNRARRGASRHTEFTDNYVVVPCWVFEPDDVDELSSAEPKADRL